MLNKDYLGNESFKELLKYLFYRGNLVTIATRNVAGAYHPQESPYQI